MSRSSRRTPACCGRISIARRNDRAIPGYLVSPAAGSDTAVVLVAGAGPSSRTDLLSQAEALAARTRTGARRVGVLGFSEGGWVAARAAAAPSVLDFLVLASTPVVTPLEQAAWLIDRPLAPLPDPVRRVPASLLAAGRAFLPYLEEDARPHLAASTIPILGLWGRADDGTVPVGTAVRQLTGDVAQPVTVVVLPGVEPAITHGVPGLPRGAWFTSPFLTLLGATLAGVTVVTVRRRHRPITKESVHVRS